MARIAGKLNPAEIAEGIARLSSPELNKLAELLQEKKLAKGLEFLLGVAIQEADQKE